MKHLTFFSTLFTFILSSLQQSCDSPLTLSNGKCECLPPYFTYNGNCINNCPSGYYFEPEIQTCANCPFGCSSCYGPNADQCYKCHSSFTNVNGICSCPLNNVLDLTNPTSGSCSSDRYPFSDG